MRHCEPLKRERVRLLKQFMEEPGGATLNK